MRYAVPSMMMRLPSIFACFSKSTGVKQPIESATSRLRNVLPSLVFSSIVLLNSMTVFSLKLNALAGVGPCCTTLLIPYVWLSARRARRSPTGAFSFGCTSVGCPLSLDTAKSQNGISSASLRCESRKCGHDGRLMPDSWTK